MKQTALITLALVLSLAVTDRMASAICVPSGLKVTSIRGRVISAPSSKGQEPLPNTLVEIRQRRYKRNGKLVESTVRRIITNANGTFDLGMVRPGKYFVYARWTAEERRTDFTFPIIVEPAPRRATPKAGLVITLGFAFADEGCHGSLAQYGNQNTLN